MDSLQQLIQLFDSVHVFFGFLRHAINIANQIAKSNDILKYFQKGESIKKNH